MRDFKKYEICQLSHKLTLDIYDFTKDLNYITKEKSVSLLEEINLIKRETYQLKQKLIA